MMKVRLSIILCFAICSFSTSCLAQSIGKSEQAPIEQLKELLLQPSKTYVMVVAHRGDWRKFPENSIPAIQSCIAMGVDMVEIDLAMTKDSVLILMHDKTLDRTTTGKGKVSDHSFDEVSELFLRDGLGRSTEWRIPTLAEAMLVCSDKILVNLDKAERYIDLVYPILNKTQTIDHVAIGSYKSLSEMRDMTGPYLDSIYFMPKLKESSLDVDDYLHHYFSSINCPIVQIKFETENAQIREYIPFIKELDKWVWINTITDNRSGGHHDDRGTYDLEGSYGWVISNGFNMIQTDRPQLLLNYLRAKGLHD